MAGIEVIIERQLRRWEADKAARQELEREAKAAPALQPVITVSRQHGSGGSTLASRLAERFHCTLLDHNLIDRICDSTGVVRRIVESLDERVKPEVTSFVESMMGQGYMDESDYAKQILETISSVSRLGGVVVVGRGANLIVGPDRGFHVRFVAPLDIRVRRVMARDSLSEKDAQHQIRSRDEARSKFIRKIWGRNIDDPDAYDLVLNTAYLSAEAATRVVGAATMEKLEARGLSALA